MRAQLIFMSLLILAALISPIDAKAGTVIIWGTNVSTAQANTTVSSAPQNVTITSWAAGNGIKTMTFAVTNASDSITVSIANISVGMIEDVRYNGTSLYGLQANSTGWITFNITQITSNATINIQPASNTVIGNVTWGFFKQFAVSLTNVSSNYTVGKNASIVLTDATKGTLNVIIPNATGLSGYVLTIKKKDATANVVAVNATGSNIDGAGYANISIQYNSITLVSDGIEWNII